MNPLISCDRSRASISARCFASPAQAVSKYAARSDSGRAVAAAKRSSSLGMRVAGLDSSLPLPLHARFRLESDHGRMDIPELRKRSHSSLTRAGPDGLRGRVLPLESWFRDIHAVEFRGLRR